MQLASWDREGGGERGLIFIYIYFVLFCFCAGPKYEGDAANIKIDDDWWNVS